MKKTGETLIEVIIALTLLIMSSAAATTSVISSLRGSGLSEDYLKAQNLGAEAIEIVKQQITTNWMKYPTQKADCWLNIAATQPCSSAVNLKTAIPTNYRVNFDGSTWTIEPESGAGSFYDLYLNPTKNIYTHASVGTTPTNFARKLIVNHADADYIDLTVEVTIKTKPEKTLSGSTILTNYSE